MSKRASERVSAAERTSKASSAKRVNEQADERVAHFYNVPISREVVNHCAQNPHDAEVLGRALPPTGTPAAARLMRAAVRVKVLVTAWFRDAESRSADEEVQDALAVRVDHVNEFRVGPVQAERLVVTFEQAGMEKYENRE